MAVLRADARAAATLADGEAAARAALVRGAVRHVLNAIDRTNTRTG